MSLLDNNIDITEESLKSIGFFRAAYDVDVEIAIHEWIKVPSYLKFIPLNKKFGSDGYISIRYIPYIEELTISTDNFWSVKKSEKVYNHINDINEINILIHQYIKDNEHF